MLSRRLPNIFEWKSLLSLLSITLFLGASGVVLINSLDSNPEKFLGKKITKIIFEGNFHVSDDDLYDVIQMRPGMMLTLGLLDDDLQAVFSNKSFSHVKIEGENYRKGVAVTFVLVERPLVSEIEFFGVSELNEQELIEAIPLKEDEVYSSRKVTESIQTVVAKYHEEGFFNAIVKMRKGEIDKKENTMKVDFLVDEGEEIRIAKINLLGVHKLDPEDLMSVMELEEDGFIADGSFKEILFEKDKDAVTNLYRQSGYLEAEIVDSRWDLRWKNPDKQEERVIIITYKIEEGEQSFFNGYDVTWNERFLNKETGKALFTKDKVTHFFEYTNSDVGDIFDNGKFSRDRGIINYLYSQQGFIFARVIPERTTIELTEEKITEIEKSSRQKEGEANGEDYYNIKRLRYILKSQPEKRGKKFIHTRFVIAEGEKGYIENIIIKGNKKTLDKVIRRELLVKEGELFNAALVQRTREIIYNLGFFKEVNVDARPGSVEGKMNLVIEVEEQPTGTISLGGGFGTQTGFSIFTEVAENNLNGTGQRVSGRVEFGPQRTALEASWTEPWLFNRPWALTLSGFYVHREILAPDIQISTNQNENSTYQKDSLGTTVGINHRFWINWGHYHRFSPVLSIASDPSSLADDTVFLLTKQGWQVKNTLTNGIYLDNRDNVFNTTQGLRVDLSVDIIGNFLGGNDHYNRYNPSFSYYWWPMDYTLFNLIRKNVLRRWRIVFEHRFSASFTQETGPLYTSQDRIENPYIETEDRLYLGGVESLRGWQLFDVNYQAAWRDGGSHRILYGTELRIPVEPSLFWLVLFFDAGALYDNYSEQIIKDSTSEATKQLYRQVELTPKNLRMSYWKYSWGFGFRLQIPILPLRIYLAKRLEWDDNKNWFVNHRFADSFEFVFGIGDRRF